METTLAEILGHDPETGAYARADLLRRFAQRAIAFDRGFSLNDIAQELGVAKEHIRLYFQGAYPSSPGRPLAEIGNHNAKARRRARLAFVGRCRRFEDAVERALETLSAKRDASPPRVIGTAEETYIQHEIVLRDLMKAPTQSSRTRELV